MSGEIKKIFSYDNYKVIFLDFDGVIKESISAKANAFQETFKRFNCKDLQKITKHHNENGGVSRDIKIPLYLRWSGCESSQKNIKLANEFFSYYAVKNVVNSDWVLGVEKFLVRYCKSKSIVLITATPNEEIKKILKICEINKFFKKVYAHPTKKNIAIESFLSEKKINKNEALFIGDSYVDYQAAMLTGVDFLLRVTDENLKEQKIKNIKKIKNFLNG